VFSYLLRRLAAVVPIIFGITVVTFLLMQLAPGDATQIYMDPKVGTLDPEVVRAVRVKWGLDAPLHVQYGRFVANLIRGDLGQSIRTNQDVVSAVAERISATARLAMAALIVAALIGISAGVFSATHRGTIGDLVGMVGALLGISVPVFWLGLMLIWVVGVKLPVLPPSGYGDGALKYLLLPGLTLGLAVAGIVARVTRSAMLEVVTADYVRTARSKGVNERTVISRHALRNALLPVVTILGVEIGGLMSGAVITETVFSWPGIGRLLVDAINQRDLPVVQGCVLLFATTFVFINLLVDVAYGFLDPRIRYG
jgi:ABC-type dipeptide/oligopeptide/nickel transport system permease component